MMRLLRLAKIIYIALKYHLDGLVLQSARLRWLQLGLNKLLFWRQARPNRAENLRLALESLGPIFVKFGQVLSTRRDLLPLDIADELAKLQDQVPPFAFEQVRDIIQQAYQAPINQVFSEFSVQPVASASVAQVHFATLTDGKQVAVKILRPDIRTTIAKDIALLDTAAWLLETFAQDGARLRPREVVDTFARHLEDELDLLLEAANATRLKRNFADSQELLIPEIYWDYCHSQVMVMQRMQGIPVAQTERLKDVGIDLSKLARNGVEIFFTQVFRDGYFHADMHPGNIQVSADGRYIALDFGIMGSLSERDKNYLARNFLAFFRQDYREVAISHVESGWVGQDVDIDAFENAIRSVCEPIFNKPLKDISFGKVLIQLFHTARRFGLIIQPQLTMLQKTLLNVEGLGRELDPNLDLWKTAKPCLERWMSEQLGWRSILKNLKREIPQWSNIIPALPRKIDQYLSRNEEEKIALQSQLEQLQHNQRRLQKTMSLLIGTIAVLIVMLLWILWLS